MTEPSATGLSDADLEVLSALADGELSEPASAAMLARIKTEPDLTKAYDALQALRGALTALEKPDASSEFLKRIFGSAMDSAADSATGSATSSAAYSAAPSASEPDKPRQNRQTQLHFGALVGVGMTCAAAASVATFFLMAPFIATPITARLADMHRQSLLDASPVQVASSDRHRVKPWLDSKIGISPAAPDLTAAGFVLLGGRIEVLNGTALPALAYRHNEHLISLLAMPAAKPQSEPQSFAANGYNIEHWVAAGFEFWAISDLEPGELHDFANAFQNAMPAP